MAEPRRGHVVAPLTLRDVLEIYDLRLLLEPPAAEAAAGRMPPEELASACTTLAEPPARPRRRRLGRRGSWRPTAPST